MTKTPKKNIKGRSKYMNYPMKTLNKFGYSMMSIDFIGPKYLKGSNNRINFLTCKYIRPNKEGIVKRIEGQTSEQAIKVLKQIWKDYFIPEVLKIDNDSAFGTHLLHNRIIGKFTLFLLNIGVIPLYTAPSSPWNNGEVEGFNNIFSKKFWNRLIFEDEQEIDIRIKDFNLAYEKYSKLISNNKEIKEKRKISNIKEKDLFNKEVNKFKTKEIYLLRIVRRKGEKGDKIEKGFINIFNEEITITKDKINMFVLCKIDLKEKKLIISTEDETGKLYKIKTQKFTIKNVQY